MDIKDKKQEAKTNNLQPRTKIYQSELEKEQTQINLRIRSILQSYNQNNPDPGRELGKQ